MLSEIQVAFGTAQLYNAFWVLHGISHKTHVESTSSYVEGSNLLT